MTTALHTMRNDGDSSGPGAWHGIHYKSRHHFTARLATDGSSEVERLRSEVARLNREMIAQEFEVAISAGTILPRDRLAFSKRMGERATLAEAREWIAATPAPLLNFAQQPQSPVRVRPPEADVGAELAQRIAELRGKHPGADFLTLQRMVLESDSALAEAYRHQPGTQ